MQQRQVLQSPIPQLMLGPNELQRLRILAIPFEFECPYVHYARDGLADRDYRSDCLLSQVVRAVRACAPWL